MKLRELASLCRLTIVGNSEVEVYSIAYADEATEKDISVAFSVSELKKNSG